MDLKDPKEAATQYVQANKLNEVFQELCTLIMHRRPTNLREFIIQQLEIMRSARECRSAPSFFTESDLGAMFSMFDVTNQGSISIAQYDQGLKSLGIDRPTLRLPESIHRVDRPLFVRSLAQELRNNSYL
ncbi:hypothetical protein LEN26_000598 [Aphanomyces euteiches]|uniref:EF-hand domain-containing protein n=1 Tax=Aphanomyces euteiches TaxID=100861 RepID=A0A6G0X290_9STRA|nr:hypothetical protein Ae201684_009451 [Aphanomyces euteiches]KAH9155049.1 hypothetical protein AeRB84_002946 [Aphanomyces euteiches]KAH9163226.1 hypothetical protein LEN26_000598 [Aphanomyces euteiches]KAH9193442.1 hypothetical protein AeNC1_004593 [Aphanomyces euteiches]